MAEAGRAAVRSGRRPTATTASGDRRYIFPQHPAEIDRLDVQHYALLAATGALYAAPVERPRLVLDAGSGTGQWGFDVCRVIPDALAVGLDLQPGKSGQPANYHFVRGNLLQGLPFAAGQFDFVHQRLLTTGIPVSCWATVVHDLVRVTRVGGWVELVEIGWSTSPTGPATERLTLLAGRVGRTLGLDTTDIIFRSLEQGLRRAGLAAVERREFRLPVGEWGGQVGSLLATDVRASFMRMCSLFEARGLLTDEEGRELIGTAMAECEELHSCLSLAIAFGHKPRSVPAENG
ncbi:MAG TPA: methyltransferase domain-containing protein [Candidatus Dormibacteraeota bacterium]|nr:methyltransferase domain-containing protein [Candidatus Dormibacteraeota bacterium]